jgi:hypothetical protein
VETEFDRCLNEYHAMEEFDKINSKSDDLDMFVPISPLLDSSFAKHKADLNRRKSLITGKKSKANCEEMASPRLNIQQPRTKIKCSQKSSRGECHQGQLRSWK